MPSDWMRRFRSLDHLRGEALKEEGQQQRIENDPEWHARALETLRKALRGHPGFAFTLDRFRSAYESEIGAPGHPNSWGALMTAARKEGLIVDTGKVEKTTREDGHARKVTVWRAM